MDRKLAAIMAVDVVAYSAHMERDEAGTYERLRAGRKELFEPEIARHHGRVFKIMGDGMLAEFGSVVDAVECAVSLQRGLSERNADLAETDRIQVRIGINLGEVIVEADDRYGEGVNIAARLEPLAEPGGICVSAKVAREVEKKLPIGFEPMGEHKVKNIAEPVEVYRVKLGGAPARNLRRPARHIGRLLVPAVAAALLAIAAGAYALYSGSAGSSLAEPPAIAVLPFENINGDEKWNRFATGMTEDIITDLASFRDISVIARSSTEAYRGKPHDVRAIGKELNVKYLLEGSLQVDGYRMRVTAQLINAKDGRHVWSERYDRAAAELLDVQDEITAKIAATLTGWQGQVSEAERALTRRKNRTDLDAYDYWLLGIEAKHRMTAGG
jgi:TolB-like protein/class 3 adenylate cyclase